VVEYTPFSLLDLKVNYSLPSINLFVNANNIFNTEYIDYANIPQPGFWLSGGAAIKF